MNLTPKQYETLLKPLAKHRVSSRPQGGKQLAYLEAWDVKAHLIRVFGFCGWSADVLSAELAFEEQDENKRWNVGYRVVMRLRIHETTGDLFGDATYTEAAVGFATLPSRGEAHDMAIKTAESDALKRAAINLGTQFGLSLYDGGNRNDVIGHTLVMPDGFTVSVETVAAPPDAVYGLVNDARAATTEAQLKTIWDQLVEWDALDSPLMEGEEATPRTEILARLMDIRATVED